MTELYYCGYLATEKYIRADLKAREVSKTQIESYLLEIRFGSSSRQALKDKQQKEINNLKTRVKLLETYVGKY